jgi:hypothetical protein
MRVLVQGVVWELGIAVAASSPAALHPLFVPVSYCAAFKSTQLALPPQMQGTRSRAEGWGLGALGGGGGKRRSAYASIPCYQCVAVALTVSKTLT